jgi:hypothetical protein
MSVGAAVPPGKASAISSCASTDSTGPAERVGRRQPRGEVEQAQRHHGEHGHAAEGHAHRLARDELADPPPGAVGLVDLMRAPREAALDAPVDAGALGARRARTARTGRRPTIVSSAGRNVSIAMIAMNTPAAPVGPRPAVPLTLASVSESRVTGDGQARRDDRRAGRAQRVPIATCLSWWRLSSSR